MKKLSLGGSSRVTGESEPRGSQAWDCLPVKAAPRRSHFPGLLSQWHSHCPSPHRHRGALGPVSHEDVHKATLSIWPGRPGSSPSGAGAGEAWGKARSVPVVSSSFILSPMKQLRASRPGRQWEDSTIPMKTTSQGLPESWALATPPSASCAECLDNWMECFAATVLPGSLSSDFRRGGARMLALGRGKEAQEVKHESGAHSPPPLPPPTPCPGLSKTTGCPAPVWWGARIRLWALRGQGRGWRQPNGVRDLVGLTW